MKLPPRIKVGDKVRARYPAGSLMGTVFRIDGAYYWVKYFGEISSNFTSEFYFDELELVQEANDVLKGML